LRQDNERNYVFRDRYPDRDSIYRLFDDRSADARREHEFLADIRYGEDARETFDFFPGDRDSPLLVFVHGGYWQSLSKDRFSFVAAAFLTKGFSVALPNYPLTPKVSVRDIVDSVKRSVPAILHAAAGAGNKPPCWIAAGHSAGGHLAAMVAVADWHQRAFMPALAGCAPISGIFDLEPLIDTSLNKTLRLDSPQAASLSPVRIPACRGRLVAFVGDAETDGFLAQSAAYADHWRSYGGDARLIRLSKRNHYTILADLIEDRSDIADEVAALADDFLEQGEGR
jgi:arylformamidase